MNFNIGFKSPCLPHRRPVEERKEVGVDVNMDGWWRDSVWPRMPSCLPHRARVCFITSQQGGVGPWLQNPFESQEANQSVWSELVCFSSDTCLLWQAINIHTFKFCKTTLLQFAEEREPAGEKCVAAPLQSGVFHLGWGSRDKQRGSLEQKVHVKTEHLKAERRSRLSYKTPSCNSFLLLCVPEKLHLADPEVSRQLWTCAVSSCSWREFSQN